MTVNGKCNVTVTHPEGKTDDGYYVETEARVQFSAEEARLYANEFALCAALLMLQDATYTEIALDEVPPGVRVGAKMLWPGTAASGETVH